VKKKLKCGRKKGVTWVVQATTSQRNPGCTEKRILVQDQDGGNAQHGKERTQHHKHLQKGLSERRRRRRRDCLKGEAEVCKKKKGVTRVAHAATLQLNPAMEGYSQYEKGNHQDKPHP
jgi:hypothetical protein